ncbi:MAG TPA: hypothetical protein VEA40_13210, partial [Ramlibacter sp.]|nr:hypothetical protein [Ramlibacter sp.]
MDRAPSEIVQAYNGLAGPTPEEEAAQLRLELAQARERAQLAESRLDICSNSSRLWRRNRMAWRR